MSIPSCFSKSLNEQELILNSMKNALNPIQGQEAFDKAIDTTSEKMGAFGENLSKIIKTVHTTKDRAKTKLQSVKTKAEIENENLGGYSVKVNLNTGIFSSETSSYSNFITNMRKIASEIPHLDFSYFSENGYVSEKLAQNLRSRADALDISENANPALTFDEFDQITGELSQESTNFLTKALTTTFKTLQAKTKESNFHHDCHILDLMIEAKMDQFQDRDLIEKLTLFIKSQEEFIAVFLNLFDTENAQAFANLFEHLYTLNLKQIEKKEDPAFARTFLFNFSRLIPNILEKGNSHYQRRAAVQKIIQKEIATYTSNPEIAYFQFQFIENNEAYFLNNLGGHSFKNEFLKTAIETLIKGPVPSIEDLKKMTAENIHELIIAANTINHIDRLKALLPEDLFTQFIDLNREIISASEKNPILSQAIRGYSQLNLQVVQERLANEEKTWNEYIGYYFPKNQHSPLDEKSLASQEVSSIEERQNSISSDEGEDISSDEDWDDEVTSFASPSFN